MLTRFQLGLARTTRACVLGVLGASLWPLLALAQTAPQADDPRAAAPAPAYRSTFDNTATGVETGRSDWRRANAEVGEFKRGHMDILKWEAQQDAAAAKPMPKLTTAPQPGGKP